MENNTFKSVAFGGFDKQDVIRYIEQTAKEAAAVQERLQQENDGLRAELQTTSAQLERLRTQLTELQREHGQLQDALSREQTARQALEPAKPEAERLAGREKAQPCIPAW